MIERYEVLVHYYESDRITIELESGEDLDEKVKEHMQFEKGIDTEMIIKYEEEQID